MAAVKNQQLLLEAFILLCQRYPDRAAELGLLLVGDGALRQSLEQRAIAAKLQHAVPKPLSPEKARAVAKADALATYRRLLPEIDDVQDAPGGQHPRTLLNRAQPVGDHRQRVGDVDAVEPGGVEKRLWIEPCGVRLRQAQSLAGRGLNSLRVRGWAGTLERWRQRRAFPAQSSGQPPSLLPAGDGSALRLPNPPSPRASIIVPVYNQLHMTLGCLRALADSGDATAFEVIVVDDGSSDATPKLLPTVPGLVFHRNARNLGFIGACNAGAAKARGEFLVFLNNDTTVQPGWLDALLATFERHPDTGLAGSKLVYPDGRLQEAGGIIFADGSCWNYGRFEDPAHPRFNFVRETDYCSGASIAIRRELFEDLDGFDAFYTPAYYEDTDLAMRVRARGLKVRYQPASVVVHHEGATSGTDLSSGVKAYQVANQKKFLARWREVLAREHLPAGTDPQTACERGRRHRVLVLDACTPTPDRDSGSVRMLARSMVKKLAARYGPMRCCTACWLM